MIRGDHNMTKIGVSTNPNARLASLRTASAFPIDFAFVGATPSNGYDIEARAHAMLAKHRCAGEWFDVPPEAAVAAIHGAAYELGQPIQPIEARLVDEILRIASAEDSGTSKPPLILRILGTILLSIAAVIIAIIITVAIRFSGS